MCMYVCTYIDEVFGHLTCSLKNNLVVVNLIYGNFVQIKSTNESYLCMYEPSSWFRNNTRVVNIELIVLIYMYCFENVVIYAVEKWHSRSCRINPQQQLYKSLDALFERTTILSSPSLYVTSQANKPAKRLVQFIHSIFWSGLQFTCYRYFYPGYYALYNQPSFFRRPIITSVILMELPGTRLTFSMAFTFYIILHFAFLL